MADPYIKVASNAVKPFKTFEAKIDLSRISKIKLNETTNNESMRTSFEELVRLTNNKSVEQIE